MKNIQLTIFDDDGPEGYYECILFERSWEAAEYIIENFMPQDVSLYNFRIEDLTKTKS